MSGTQNRVCITGTGSFLPGRPVSNDQIDDVLGPIDGAPPKVRQFVETVGRRMLEGSGIETRHFAIERETRRLTHNIAGLAEAAARPALDAAGLKPGEIDLLLLSTSGYDATTPPTSTRLQERLGIERCAEMEIHSNCAGVGKCVQVACDALRLGRYRRALIVYPQLSSVYLRSCYFNQPVMTKTHAALRYILADGAGALVLEARPGDQPSPGGEVEGTFVESIGGKRPPGMTAGGGVDALQDFAGIPSAVYERGNHHLDQDFAAVNRDAGPTLLGGVERMLQTLAIPPATIDHFIWSIPTRQLYDDNLEQFGRRLSCTPDKMKFRARQTGYCGGASILLHFDAAVRSGELQRGQRVALHSVESSKWMTAGFVVRW
jgi:3-oxoacyl-[acyl-carrier-protein] synthase III